MAGQGMPESPLSGAAVRRIGRADVAWLTTLRSDGSPHTTPVWFVFDDPVIRIATSSRNAKVRNLRGDPRVSIAIDGSSDAPLVGEGTGTLVPISDAGDDVANAFARKYIGWDIRDESVDGERVILEIRITRWLLAG